MIDPKGTWELALSRHEEGFSPKPVFLFRIMSARQRREMIAAFEAADKEAESAKLADASAAQRFFDAHVDAIRLQLAGWRNMVTVAGEPVGEYAIDKFEDVITDADLFELRARLAFSNLLSAQEKKSSGLPSPSSTAESVSDVAPAESA